MTALADLKDRPPKTSLASLPGNRGVGTCCRSSCSHTSYRWLQKRKSNPRCTQTFNENCIKSWHRWNHLQDQTCLWCGHKDSKTSWILHVPRERVTRWAQTRVAGGIWGFWLAAESILPESCSLDLIILPSDKNIVYIFLHWYINIQINQCISVVQCKTLV